MNIDIDTEILDTDYEAAESIIAKEKVIDAWLKFQATKEVFTRNKRNCMSDINFYKYIISRLNKNTTYFEHVKYYLEQKITTIQSVCAVMGGRKSHRSRGKSHRRKSHRSRRTRHRR
jgi:hypothetical protein